MPKQTADTICDWFRLASGKAKALLPRDESIRFQSASGDEMQYVNDLPVCIRIGDEIVWNAVRGLLPL